MCDIKATLNLCFDVVCQYSLHKPDIITVLFYDPLLSITI